MKNWDMDERCRKGDSTVFPKAIPTAHCKDAGDSGELTQLEGHLWKREELVVRQGEISHCREVRNGVMGPEPILNG